MYCYTAVLCAASADEGTYQLMRMNEADAVPMCIQTDKNNKAPTLAKCDGEWVAGRVGR